MQFFFDEEKKFSKALAAKIERACTGSNYLSETNAPVELFVGTSARDVSVDTILHQTRGGENRPVEEIDAGVFFARLTAEHDWDNDAQRTQAKKFLELQKLLEENLRDLKVYRIGRIRLDIYVVGIDRDGTLLGVKTEAVET